MAVLPDEVRPGDLISSAWLNTLLAKLAELDAQVQQLGSGASPGTITVPNVFGRTLSQARSIITLAAQQLVLGSVVDTVGNIINPDMPGSASLMVLVQIPAAGTKTIPGAGVNLVVAATGTGPVTVPQPDITGTLPAGPLPVTSQIEIVGTNFAILNTDNVITFGGVPSPSPPGSNSNAFSLQGVIVPTGIPGAPTASGQANLSNVPIVVTTPLGGASEPFLCTIAPPPAVPLSNIDVGGFSPATAFLGQTLRITGTGFSSQAGNNLVEFDDNEELRQPVSLVETVSGAPAGTLRLTTTVPASGMGLDTAGADRTNVPIAVVVNGVKGNTRTTRIRNPNL